MKPKQKKKKVFSIDFETYYGKELSIDTHGLYHYLRDPASSIYLVSVYSPEEDGAFAYVGSPEKMNWQVLDGHTLCAHNARFDRACFERLQELGIVPAELQVDWVCTADMVSALSYGRSLKASVEGVFGFSISKDTRTDMKGKTWEDAVKLGMAKRLGEYCLKDTSATARDVLGEILLNLDAAGYRVVMHIHDEVVVEVPTEKVDTALKEVQRIMTTAPEWLEGLPLAAETTSSTFYTK